MKKLKFFRHLLAPLVLAILAALMIAKSSRAGDAGPDWDFLIDQQNGTHVHFGVHLGGPFPFQRGAEDVMPPASLSKLFTAAVALEKLGPEFRYETRIEWRNPFPRDEDKISDLTIYGSGDPSWEIAQFDQIAQGLKEQRVREIHGGIHLVAADPRWMSAHPPVGWLPQDLAQCDGALPQAFNIQLNCAMLMIDSPTASHWRESGISTPVKLSIDWGTETVLSAKREGDTYRISGIWSDANQEVRIPLPAIDTLSWAEHLFVQALRSKGIRILPRSPAYAGHFVLANHALALYSPPLKDLLKPMLKDNVNLIGESLFITLGGADAFREYINKYLPNEKTISIWDGSGLSRSSTTSANALMGLLTTLAKSPDFQTVWDALAVAGVDGSLAGRMRGTEAEGVLRGKTGNLRGYYHLAGYIPRFDASGKPTDFIPFVMLGEARPSARKAARAAQDRVGAALVRTANY